MVLIPLFPLLSLDYSSSLANSFLSVVSFLKVKRPMELSTFSRPLNPACSVSIWSKPSGFTGWLLMRPSDGNELFYYPPFVALFLVAASRELCPPPGSTKTLTDLPLFAVSFSFRGLMGFLRNRRPLGACPATPRMVNSPFITSLGFLLLKYVSDVIPPSSVDWTVLCSSQICG